MDTSATSSYVSIYLKHGDVFILDHPSFSRDLLVQYSRLAYRELSGNNKTEFVVEVDDGWFAAPESYDTVVAGIQLHEIKEQAGLQGTPFDDLANFAKGVGGIAFLFQIRLYEAFIVLEIDQRLQPAWLRDSLVEQLLEDELILTPAYLELIWRTFYGKDQGFVDLAIRKMAKQLEQIDRQDYESELQQVLEVDDELQQTILAARENLQREAEQRARQAAIAREEDRARDADAEFERVVWSAIYGMIAVILLILAFALSWGSIRSGRAATELGTTMVNRTDLYNYIF
jgi:hypothetical protein